MNNFRLSDGKGSILTVGQIEQDLLSLYVKEQDANGESRAVIHLDAENAKNLRDCLNRFLEAVK